MSSIFNNFAGFTKHLTDRKYIMDTQHYLLNCPNSIIPINRIIAETYLAVDTVKDSYDIIANNITGFAIGQYVIMFNPDLDNAYYGFIQNINVNTLTMNVPINAVYPAGITSVVDGTTISMNVVASKVSPVIFRRRGVDPSNLPNALICAALEFTIITDTLPEFSDFGDIDSGLTNGIEIRQIEADGKERHILSIRNNAELQSYCGSQNFLILDATNPAFGVNGIAATLDFAQLGNSVAMPRTGDIKIIIQDDLSSLDSFNILVKGHFKCRGIVI